MPRVVFESSEQMWNWVNKKVSREKYEVYLTSEKEIIFVPSKSTQPILYGYYKPSPEENVKEIIENLKESKKLTVFDVKWFEWKSDLPPGVAFISVSES